MNFVTSVFKKYINKDEAKTQKNPKSAAGPSTTETSRICEVKETNNVAPASENKSQSSAPLSDDEDCFQDANAMLSNVNNNQNSSLSILEAASNKESNITEKVEYLFENKNIKDLDTIDNSMGKFAEPQETPVKMPNNTIEVFQADDYQSLQKNDKAGETSALDNAEVNQAAKFVSLNDILFDSYRKLDKQWPREDLKSQNEANMDTERSAFEVLIGNVNAAFVCATDTTEKNNEENYKVQSEPIMAEENHLDKENLKACKNEELETQKRKCEDVEEIVKKLKTDKYTDSVGVEEKIENQNKPEKIVNKFVSKPGESQDTDICKIQIEENIQFNGITQNFTFQENNNNEKDNEIVQLKSEAANRFLEENEIEINSSEQVTKTTNEQREDIQGTKTSESSQNTEITNEILKQEMDVDSRMLNKTDDDNIKEKGLRKNLKFQSKEKRHNEKELMTNSGIENLNDAFVEHKDKEDKLQQQSMSSVKIQSQQDQANLEKLGPQNNELSPTKELVNSLTNAGSINETSDVMTTLKQKENEGNTYDLENPPVIQEDSSEKVNLVENKDQQTRADLGSLLTQIKDLPTTKELSNYFTNSDIVNTTSIKETSLKQERNKGKTSDLINAPIIQENSSKKLMLEQNKGLVVIEDQQLQANQSLVTQKKDFSPTKELFNSLANSESINETSDINTTLKQEGNKDNTYDLENDPIIQEDSSVKVVMEKRSVEVNEDLNHQDAPGLSKNQDIHIQEISNTETDATKKLTRELEQSQAIFKSGTTENIKKNLVEKDRGYSEEVVVCAPKSISDITKEGNYKQNLLKSNAEECEKKITIQNYLVEQTREEEQLMRGNKTIDRQDTKEFEKLERECKMNLKSDTTIDEENLMHKMTNFGRQDTQEFENLEKKIAMNVEKTQSITDILLDELVLKSTTDNKVCQKCYEKNGTEDHQCVAPDQASELKIANLEEIKKSDTKIVSENEKLFFRQDTLEFEKLEKQCTDVPDVGCLDVLDELVAQSTRDNSIGNAELIESIESELISASTPCNENAFEKTMEGNKSGQEETVVEAPHQKIKTTFLKIHLQNKNAGRNQGETKSNAEEKDDDKGENKLLRIQVRAVNKNKQQNQLSEVECQTPEKYKTADEELKSKVDDLQLELESIRKMNRRKGKCISTSKVEMKESDVISKYKNIINEYEKQIVQQNSDLEKLKIENETNMRHFTNTEMAFSDVFEKYEKAKYVIAAYAKNEDILLENLQNAEEQLTKTVTKCDTMKEQSFQQIKQAKHHVEHEKQKYNQEIAKLQGQIKRLEIKASSLEVALKQKTDECQALANLCDDITGRHST